MKKTMILLLVSVLAFALGATSVFGIIPDNTTLTFQNDDATFVTTGATTAAQGGNITNLSLNQTAQTNYWHAFYGDVVKHIFLADTAATNVVYDWGSQALGGWIYFANATGIDWTAVVLGDQTDRENEDATLGLGAEVENVNDTFTDTTHSAIADIGGGLAGNTGFGVDTNSNGGTDWDTVLLRGGAGADSAAIYASEVQQDNQNYAGANVDYQIMVPVAQATGVRTYSVYAGLE